MEKEIEKLKTEYEELQKKLLDPKLVSDIKKYGETAARASKIEKIMREYETLKKLKSEIGELKKLTESGEKEIAELALAEFNEKEIDFKKGNKLLNKMLTGGESDEDVTRVIMEIRAGAGGQEAALFAGELFSMYKKFAEKKRWSLEILDANQTTLGGYKEIVFGVSGKEVYSALNYESGVHRIQRIPETEKTGRIHTSTASVAVLPEAKDVDIEVKPEDVKVEFYRSSGPGGQNVNKVETAVRLIHLPTGVTVNCQEGRSQQKNREKAMTILKTRLLDAKRQEEEKKMTAERRKQIGTADRSEKIRTYNFPQDRITDHRIGKSWHNIASILNGNMELIIKEFE